MPRFTQDFDFSPLSVVEDAGHGRLVEEYGRAIEEKKPDGARKTVLVIDPTHKDGDELSEALRALRKEKGLIDRDERTFSLTGEPMLPLAAQSNIADIVLAVMNKSAVRAMGAEQIHVIVSRGRERTMIFTDMPQAEFLPLIEL